MSWWAIKMTDSANNIELFRFDGAHWPDDHVKAFKKLDGVGPFSVQRVVPDALPPLNESHMAIIEDERRQAQNCMTHRKKGTYCGCIGGWKNGRPCPNNTQAAAA